MSWFEFTVILLATVLLAVVQLAGWIGCFAAGWQMVFVYGPTLESAGLYTLGWMVALQGLILLGGYCLKRSLYWFDRAAHFMEWKVELDRCYSRGAGYIGRSGRFGG